MQKKVTAAFTLVELLTVVAITALVGAGISTAFLMAMRLWSRAQATDGITAETILPAASLITQLRNAVPLPELPLRGDARRIRFVAPRGTLLEYREYRYEPAEQIVWLRQADVSAALAADDERDIEWQEREFIRCDEWEFAYLVHSTAEGLVEWQSEWDPETAAADWACLAVRLRTRHNGYDYMRLAIVPRPRVLAAGQ